MSKCQERVLQAGQSLFIDPLKQIEPLLYVGLIGRTDQKQLSVWSPASDRPMAAIVISLNWSRLISMINLLSANG